MRISDWSSDVCSSDLWRPAGGLHHEGAADGQRGRDLVGGKVQREIERGDEAARPDRHPLQDAEIAPRALGDVEWLHFARHPYRFLGGHTEGVDQPRDISLGIVEWLSRLDAQLDRK